MFVIGLVLLVVGISYAMYTFIGTGTKENVITTGQIKISFAEQNNIKIQNRYPETDAEGLANTDEDSQMTFTITGEIKGEATVEYAIGLAEIKEGTTLKQDDIKIYLTKNGSVANGFKENVGRTIGSFSETKIEDFLDSHVIGKGVITGTEVDTYTLKAWINEDYNLPTNLVEEGKTHSSSSISEEFSFKIKAVGVQGILKDESGANRPQLASNMIPVYYENGVWKKADEENIEESYKWYDYDNKMWANAVTVTNTNRATYLKASAGTPIDMNDINTMWVWIPRFNATNGILDCSTIENPTVEKYPGCYDANLTDTDKQKIMGALQQFGDPDSEGSLNKLLNGEEITLAGYTGDLLYFISFYNELMTPDIITPVYDKFNPTKKVTTVNGTGDIKNPGAFNIDFTSVGEKSHDAFTFGEEDLEGFWIGKFETSHKTLSENTSYDTLKCTNETCENAKGIEILPNKVSLRRNNVSAFFYAGRSIAQNGNLYGLNKNEVDTHMLKNNEWGAVAYLSQSIYGRCLTQVDCPEIGINNYGGYFDGSYKIFTGYGAPAGSDNEEDDDEYVYVAPQAYDTTQGMDASTTGNIYGVYDMSGGAYEYVMGVHESNSVVTVGSYSGFTVSTLPNSKYYNTYTNEGTYDNVISNYTNDLQHALTETGVWYGDAAGFVDSDYLWFLRGGYFVSEDCAGVFAFDSGDGDSSDVNSFRAALVK